MLSLIRRLFDRQPDAQRVASMVLQRLQQQLPGETLVYDPAQFQIRRADGALIYLHNMFRDYCKARPAQRQEQIERFVLGMLNRDRPSDFAAAKGRLLPVLRHLAGVDLVRIEGGTLWKPLEEAMMWRPFSPVLGAAVAVDSDHAIAQVGQDDLERWGIGFDEAFAIAVENLRHKAAPSFVEIAPGLFASNYGDYYDAARIFLTELAWQLPLNGEPVAMAPNRIRLLLCGANDQPALAQMVHKAREVLREHSRPLSSEMFKLADGQWSLWTPPGEAGRLLATLRREDMAADYADQHAALEKANQQAGIDVFVAKHTLVRRDGDGALVSYCVLPKDVDTWLPEADLVALSETPQSEPTFVPWAHFMAHAQHLVERLPLAMPRWKVLGFPDGECMQRLRSAATNLDEAKV